MIDILLYVIRVYVHNHWFRAEGDPAWSYQPARVLYSYRSVVLPSSRKSVIAQDP